MDKEQEHKKQTHQQGKETHVAFRRGTDGMCQKPMETGNKHKKWQHGKIEQEIRIKFLEGYPIKIDPHQNWHNHQSQINSSRHHEIYC